MRIIGKLRKHGLVGFYRCTYTVLFYDLALLIWCPVFLGKIWPLLAFTNLPCTVLLLFIFLKEVIFSYHGKMAELVNPTLIISVLLFFESFFALLFQRRAVPFKR